MTVCFYHILENTKWNSHHVILPYLWALKHLASGKEISSVKGNIIEGNAHKYKVVPVHTSYGLHNL